MALRISDIDEAVRPEGQEGQAYFVEKVIKGDTYLVEAQSSMQYEDEFQNYYYSIQNQSNLFLTPPHQPLQLKQLVVTNNILDQCIEAMEVNIDATGHEFVSVEEDKEVDAKEKKEAEAFFSEPYPNTSFTKIRRKLRRDMESIGYAFLEVLRNVGGDIVALRNVETHNMRLVKLDEPIMVKKTIRDNETINYMERERRFGQMVAQKTKLYYREFGATRQVDRFTGEWEKTGKDATKIPPERQGSELLMFGVHPDVNTSYFLPRWINQAPSVIGSRKAEEQNLEFFDAGGIPPAIIFIQGGILAKATSTQLNEYLSGKNRAKHRAVVVEAQSSSGSMESAGAVKVTVERFGAERSQDAFYMAYDQAAEEHVRIAFRIPPLFLGKPADYNFATAVTAYMVAEEQVFQPERTAFDEVINMTIIKAKGWKTLKLKSKPISLTDAEAQLQGLTLASDKVTTQSLIDEVNKITDMSLKPMDQQVMPDGSINHLPPGTQIPTAEPPPNPEPVPGAPIKVKPGEKLITPPTPKPQQRTNVIPMDKGRKTARELIDLVKDYIDTQITSKAEDLKTPRATLTRQLVDELGTDDRTAFNSLLAVYTTKSDSKTMVDIVRHSH